MPTAQLMEAEKFAVSELVVAPAIRGRRLSSRLMAELLRYRPEPYAILLSRPGSVARTIYHHWGRSSRPLGYHHGALTPRRSSRGQPGVDDCAPELAVQVHNGVLALGRRDQRRQPGLPSVLPYVMSWRIGRVCGLGLASLQLWRRPASMDRRLACEAQLPRLSSRTCENSGAALPGARADRMIIAPVPST